MKEIFDEESDGIFEDEEESVEEMTPKAIIPNIFKESRDPTPSELLDVVEVAKSETKRGRPVGSLNKNHEYKRKKLEREEALKKLWKLGKLHWILDSLQRDLHNQYYSKSSGEFVWMISRQIGKSTCVCTIACEEAIRNPGIRMAYILPELNDAKDITEQSFDFICIEHNAPPEFIPKFNSMKNRWEWQNGSFLKVVGTDNNNYNKIRGRKYNRVFFDEFCFSTDFKKVLFSCVYPTTTSIPDAKIVFISTPPETADHDSNIVLDKAEEEGTLVKKTIYDSPRFTPETIEEKFISRYRTIGGKDSIEFRREYMAERIADTSKLVIPEASKEKLVEITAKLERPEFYNIYEAFDWGVKDSNGGLFGYINYDTQQLIIEEEMLYHDSTSTTYDIAKKIIAAEISTWGEELRQKIQRYADNNLQIINDMSLNFNLHMMATNKDNLAAQVQKVRHLLSNGQIIINPKCVNLIEQIQSAQWNSSRKSFVRRNGHHYDLVAALIYLVRNCQLEVSPFPIDYHLKKFNKEISHVGRNNIYGKTDDNDVFRDHLKKCFGIRKVR